MRKPCVAGNWKMHKNVAQATALVESLIPGLEEVKEVENVLCPPFTSLAPVAKLLEGTSVALGAQNVFWEEEGAYTGEISPVMLSELVSHVIIGHSERRAYFGETDETVKKRVHAALENDLKPILCVGETLEENEAGRTEEVVSRQVKLALDGVAVENGGALMIAYEPVWAIGTGKAATPEGANAVIAEVIRPQVSRALGPSVAEAIRVLYGGSVKPHNAADFFEQPDIDGALVGGASLKAASFIEITKAAA
ncbi:MAG: triose-phosphate isomerase [Anaerolineales bacterium]